MRVDVSVDEGQTWTSADLTEGAEQPLHRAWAWTFFECEINKSQLQKAALKALANDKPLRLVSKATDAAYNVQPETLLHIWNLRGINNNACHRVEVKPDASTVDNDTD